MMDSSKKAVESYWRYRMVDAATSAEDKVTPVYKLEEICDLLRTSHVSVVKEISEFVLKRLDHKNPIVKQKVLRLIKYCVGKSGPEFRREMQRNSAAMRNLAHYRGQPDDLKGDALNKAVRVTATEVISTIFSEENKPEPVKEVNKRIQGFGNTSMEMPSEDRKSFLSEVVEMGSASIMHGLSNITQGHPPRKNENGGYTRPNLQRSLTVEAENNYDRYEPVRLPNETQYKFDNSRQMIDGTLDSDHRSNHRATTSEGSTASLKTEKTREGRLLETIVTSGGVRLHPTREATQVFLADAAKLDPLKMSHAIETKLESPIWQVRVKALCVLESILRKKDDERFSLVASYFVENIDILLKCSESPQSSLRDKGHKVLSLLGWEHGENASRVYKSEKLESNHVQMPDLLDTGFEDDILGENSGNDKREHTTTVTPFAEDLLGEGFDSGISGTHEKEDEDPFNDVSFHPSGASDDVDNLFSGLVVDKISVTPGSSTSNKNEAELLDLFGSNIVLSEQTESHKPNLTDLMSDLSVNGRSLKENFEATEEKQVPINIFAGYGMSGQSNHDGIRMQGSHESGMNAGHAFASTTTPLVMGNGIMLSPAFQAQSFNYDALATFLAQQQVLASVTSMQHLGNPNPYNAGLGPSNGSGYSPALPDIFQSSNANPAPISSISNTRKEETKAFDFISDHLAAARDPKRVI